MRVGSRARYVPQEVYQDKVYYGYSDFVFASFVYPGAVVSVCSVVAIGVRQLYYYRYRSGAIGVYMSNFDVPCFYHCYLGPYSAVVWA